MPSTARIGIPELRIGVPLPMMAIEIVRFVARPQSFQDVVQRGAMFTGREAVDAGLASELAEPDAIASRTQQILEELVHVPPEAYWITKRQCRWPAARTAQSNQEQWGEPFWEIWQADATRNAIRTYVAERLGVK